MTTNTKLLQAAFSVAVVSTSLVACGSDLGGVDAVDVPEVRASVAIDELCDLANELRCAGAMGCCEADAAYASAEECLAASTSCEALIADVTGSELFVDGTISYDAELAASVLQAAADSTAGCGTEAAMPELNSLFTGSLGEGEDCTPRDNSGAHMLACAPGLTCMVDEDIEGVEGVFGSCEHLDVQPAAAADDSDADSMTSDDLYCAAPEQPSPPSNATVAVGLSINVWNSSGAATNDKVYLHFINKNMTTEYYCTITGGLDANETKVCTNIQTRTYNGTPSNNLFWVETNGTDGLKVDSFAVCTSLKNNNTECDGTAFTSGTFDNGDTSMLTNTKIWAWGAFDDGYDAFWVDGSGNGSCSGAKINLSNDNTVTCGTHTIANH